MSDEQRFEHTICHDWEWSSGQSWVDGPGVTGTPREGVLSLQEDGWELVAVTPSQGRSSRPTYYLKRPAPQEIRPDEQR